MGAEVTTGSGIDSVSEVLRELSGTEFTWTSGLAGFGAAVDTTISPVLAWEVLPCTTASTPEPE